MAWLMMEFEWNSFARVEIVFIQIYIQDSGDAYGELGFSIWQTLSHIKKKTPTNEIFHRTE